MGRPKEVKEKIRQLYDEGKRPCEIAKVLNLKYSYVYNYTRAFEKGFSSPGEERNDYARQRGFASFSEYQLFRHRQRGLRSRFEYNEYIALSNGFRSSYEYQTHLARQRGFRSSYEYQTHLARQRGFASLSEYEMYRRKEKQKLPQNHKLSELLRSRLADVSKSQKWLAGESRIPERSISRYATGQEMPPKERLEKIASVLNIDQKSLEDILK